MGYEGAAWLARPEREYDEQPSKAEGYRFDRVIDVLPWQHILVFRR